MIGVVEVEAMVAVTTVVVGKFVVVVLDEGP